MYQSPHAGKNLATAARLVTVDFDNVHARLRANGVTFEWYEIDGMFDEPGDQQPYWDNVR